MWGAIERVTNDLQELVQRDVGIDEEEDDTNPLPATTNLDGQGSAPGATTTWTPRKGGT